MCSVSSKFDAKSSSSQRVQICSPRLPPELLDPTSAASFESMRSLIGELEKPTEAVAEEFWFWDLWDGDFLTCCSLVKHWLRVIIDMVIIRIMRTY